MTTTKTAARTSTENRENTYLAQAGITDHDDLRSRAAARDEHARALLIAATDTAHREQILTRIGEQITDTVTRVTAQITTTTPAMINRDGELQSSALRYDIACVEYMRARRELGVLAHLWLTRATPRLDPVSRLPEGRKP